MYDANAPLRGAWGDGSTGQSQGWEGRKGEGAVETRSGEQDRTAPGENGETREMRERRETQ